MGACRDRGEDDRETGNGDQSVTVSLPMVRPRTRGECVDGPRPCPWVSCRYHLGVDVVAGWGEPRVEVRHPDSQGELDLEAMAETCALDVADDGPRHYEVIADHLGISRARVQQVEQVALRRAARRGGTELAELAHEALSGAARRAGEAVEGPAIEDVSGEFASQVARAYERVVPERWRRRRRWRRGGGGQ